MTSREERIRELEEELRSTKYNKRTQHHIGLTKAKLAKAKEGQHKSSTKGLGYSIKKTGDACVVLLGFPSVGKSTLLNKLTNAQSPVAAYDFTTLSVIPGLLYYRHAKIQILDLPGVVYGAASGRGRGREVLSVVRNADLALILIDAYNPQQGAVIEREVSDAEIRLNQKRPAVKITKKKRGGISIGATIKLTQLSVKTAEAIVREMGVVNADVLIREDVTDDQLIDAVEGNKAYIPAITVINKADLLDNKTLEAVRAQIKPDVVISAETGAGLEELKEKIFAKLSLMRIYLKEVGKRADMDEPLIIKQGSTIMDVCNRIHKDFARRFRFARIWRSSRFEQSFRKLNKELADGDIVEIHLR